MNHYLGSGVTVASGAVADNAICGIWNPSTSKSIFVKQIHLFKTAVGGSPDIPKIRRATARGTSASSVTPGIGADASHALAPESGAILDLDYSAEPTLEAGDLVAGVAPSAIGSGYMWVFDEWLTVKQNDALNLVVGTALAFPIARFTVWWAE